MELDTVLRVFHSVSSHREFPQTTTRIPETLEKLAEKSGFENTLILPDFKYLQVLSPRVWLLLVLTFQQDMSGDVGQPPHSTEAPHPKMK